MTLLEMSQLDMTLKRSHKLLSLQTLGQPTHRVVGLHTNPLYVNTVPPAYGQYSVPWLPPQMFGAHLVYPTLVLAGYYCKTGIGSLWTEADYSVNNGHCSMDCL